MTNKMTNWSKEEIKVYIFLLCARADSEESVEELELIKSKTNAETFNKMYHEFCEDDEDLCFEKLEDSISQHHFSTMELSQLRQEIRQVFFADKKFTLMEQRLDKVLDNIIY